MLVCVTGGTGFVGAHSVASIRAARPPRPAAASATSPQWIRLGALGIPPGAVDVVRGDVLDERA